MSCDQKKLIRIEAIAKRKALSFQERKMASENMMAYILSLSSFLQAESVLIYAAFGEELATFGLMEAALSEGKKVYLPKVVSAENSVMEFYQIHTPYEVKPGYCGILEPEESNRLWEAHGQNEKLLMIVPGVAFTLSGNRLGYGKGFYDNYLRKHPDLQSCTIGVGYRCQLYEELPVEEGDIRLRQVCVF